MLSVLTLRRAFHLSSLAAVRIWRANASGEIPRLLRSETLDVDGSAWLELEGVDEPRVARRTNEDAARRGQPLEPACQIYGLSPHVVAELLRANDSGGDLS